MSHRWPPKADPPESLVQAEERLPVEWRQRYLQRAIDKLPADLTTAFDRIWQQQRALDQKEQRIQQLQKAARQQRWKNVLGLIAGLGNLAGLALAMMKIAKLLSLLSR
ncbi:MAG TPA: hypothetical protein VE866_08360 [Candidatus Binatia bacterium]|jgi:adenosine deaminase|nr:hypothetical protein [Candidatus Binatia bacterium]